MEITLGLSERLAF